MVDKLGAFYSGGPVQLSQDGQYVFTTCNNSVQVVSYKSGQVDHTIEEVKTERVAVGKSTVHFVHCLSVCP